MRVQIPHVYFTIFALAPCIGSLCYHVVAMSDIFVLFTLVMIHTVYIILSMDTCAALLQSCGLSGPFFVIFFWSSLRVCQEDPVKNLLGSQWCFQTGSNTKVLNAISRKYSDFCSLAALPFQKSIWLVANVCWYTWRMVEVTMNRCGQVTPFTVHLTRSTSNRTLVLGFFVTIYIVL